MTDLATIDQYIQDNQQSHIDQLCELLRIPSLSADPAFAPQLGQAATLVANYLRSNGFDVQVFSEYGPPVIYAESPKVPGAPVALVYGHYDVQPPDPLDQWVSPPFEPQIRNGNLYARGATDDKGQLMTHLHSVAAWRATGQPLPMQVKFLIEGEEEFGSAALEKFLAERADLIASDVIVISDSSQFGPGKPAITYGLRGIAYFELRVHGPKQDLHSGSFGGAVTNPAIVLTKILSSMTDPQGRIQLPGFYDGVVELQESEREMWRALGFDEAKFCQQLAVDGLSGEAGFSTLERRWARPTFDINGLFGGYQGEGGKTIIPAMAGAKFSFRLVPNQDPKQVADHLRAFLAGHQYPGVRLELIDMHGGPGVVTNPNGPFMAAAQQAVEIGFGTQAVLIREGGSIPIVAEMVHKTGADVLLLGWGLDDDNAHSPNEKFCVADYYKGIRASCHLWHHLASVKKP